MPKIPISIQKIKIENYLKKEHTQYLISIIEKESNFNKTIICDRDDLVKFSDGLQKILSESNTSERLKISDTQAKVVDNAHANDELCLNCKFKMSYDCVTCLFKLQSPLERNLFLKLKQANIYFKAQHGLDWQGNHISTADRTYDDQYFNFKNVLTIVDFYIEVKRVKLCIYADGHTYHERTEEQAQHDRRIDRRLQELGFKSLRYTGKEIRENANKIILDIQKWMGS